jgi:hypothetical protein
VKKKLYIRRHLKAAGDLEAMVIKNTPTELISNQTEINELICATDEVAIGMNKWRCNYPGHEVCNGRTAEFLSAQGNEKCRK